MTDFNDKLKNLFETYGHRNGFGVPDDSMPVVGMDYNEDPVPAPSTGSEPGESHSADMQPIVDLLDDIAYRIQDDPDTLELVVKAKQIITDENNDGGSVQPNNPAGSVVASSQGDVATFNEDMDNPHQSKEVDPTAGNVTDGSSSIYGADRSDDMNYEGKDDTKGEIASLLVTIGHILYKDRMVPNKFEMPLVLRYLNHNFTSESPDDMTNLCEKYNRKSR